jgi:hypothetical protein
MWQRPHDAGTRGSVRPSISLRSFHKEIKGTIFLSYPGSKKHITEASIRVPGMFNRRYSNNMINR